MEKVEGTRRRVIAQVVVRAVEAISHKNKLTRMGQVSLEDPLLTVSITATMPITTLLFVFYFDDAPLTTT